MTESASRLRVIEETPAYWRVVFDNPPLNIMDADMFEGLQDLLARMDTSPILRVVVFESANPDFYLAHFEVKDTARTLTLLQTVGPSGLPSLLDTFVRLTKSPVVSIAKIRGRARGISSEFLLACDMRFASRENTALAQVEVGSGVHPGGGEMARYIGRYCTSRVAKRRRAALRWRQRASSRAEDTRWASSDSARLEPLSLLGGSERPMRSRKPLFSSRPMTAAT